MTCIFFSLLTRPPPTFTLFPYTTLFRSLLFLLFAVATASAQTEPPKYPEPPPSDPFKARLIPRNSKIYIAPMVSEDPNKPEAQGFESYLAAALRKKDVPLIIVADRSQANFAI